MWNLFKKLIFISLVFFVLGYIFNVKVGDKPTRTWVGELWQSDDIQSTYSTVMSRVKALINQEISLEQIFSANPKSSKTTSDKKVIPPELKERLSDRDQILLEQYIQKN